MKKSLIGIFVLGATGIACAQSSLTIFGVVDASVSHYASKSEDGNSATLASPFYVNQGSVTVSRNALANSAYNNSRLGFRGTEDLGGGLAAGFWLESPITNDDGATGLSTFSRRSTVSLMGGFGEIRLGRDFAPTFWNDTVYDPFGAVGVGANLISSASLFNPTGGAGGFGGNANYLRVSNAIGYFLPPALGGFYGQFMYALHENNAYDPGTATPPGVNPVTGQVNAGAVASTRAGRYVGGRIGYANGPLDVALSYGSSTVGDNYFAGTTDDVNTANLGASYDFGILKLFGELSRVRSTRDYAVAPLFRLPDTDVNGYLIGATVPVGPGLVRASFSRVKYDLNSAATTFSPPVPDPKASKFSLSYVHNLSKRTALYATVARISNQNGAALTVGGPAFISTGVFTPKTSTGYDFGIRHAF
ncbi:Outer membrane porin protein 32 precursor [Variovorax sp. SRS16]|uniref:porin n=1 Tax=Variovorax sp. SRS16 TaxID=282217 RepID=UPI00131791FD|nr:porin [Variovorax sp. SRS16]VTU30948.1 Outer membrane porin protein 32 precursor [Variovorax sp. SRS16]